MRSIILVIGILLAATSATTPAHSGNVYDRSGKYLGSTVRNADGSTIKYHRRTFNRNPQRISVLQLQR